MVAREKASERLGARLATAEIDRLDRLRAAGRPVGAIRSSTPVILERAAGGEHPPNRATMREIYERLRVCDDGLPPAEQPGLLVRELFRSDGP